MSVSRHNSPSEDGEVQLTVGKQKFAGETGDSGWDFGDQRVEFEVPEFAAHTRSEVTVSLCGLRSHFPEALDPAKKWNLFIVPHTHLDVGYTDYQAKVAEAQSRTLDEAIQMIHDHPDFRFSPDGFWCVRHFFDGLVKACAKLGQTQDAYHQFPPKPHHHERGKTVL